MLDFTLLQSDLEYFESLKALADQLAPGRITFQDAIPLTEVVRAIADYDIGFCVVAPTSYSYQMSLPNKLFEFIMAGLAVISGASPAMAQIVHDHHVGWTAPSFEPEDFAVILNALNVEQIEQARKNALTAAKILNAEAELGKLKTYYDHLRVALLEG